MNRDGQIVTWEDFARTLQTAAEQSPNREAFSNRLVTLGKEIRGRRICWRATIKKLKLDREGDIPRTHLTLQPLPRIVLAETPVQLGGLHLPLKPDDVARWRDLKQGDAIVFSATLGSKSPIFPTLELWDSSIGYLVKLTLSEGTLYDSVSS